MKLPIDRNTFGKLVRTRKRMIEKNPNPERVQIAAPFVPWIGNDIFKGTPGIYFIGIATRGPSSEEINFDKCRKWSEAIASERPAGPFWRYIGKIAEAVYAKKYPECMSRIAWSNQLKIGIFDTSQSPKPRNPTGIYSDMQDVLCRSILRRELRLASNSVVIFLGHGPLIGPVVGKNDWDGKRYQRFRIWIKERRNGAPIFYQDHPGWILRQGGEYFSGHAEVVARAVRQYLSSRVEAA